MRLKIPRLVVVLALVLLMAPLLAHAQPPAPLRRIGVVDPGPPPTPDAIAQFVDGLRDLGYVEGQHITLEYRWAEGNLDRLSELVAELVHLPVDILVAGGTAALTAKHATTTIPIVFIATAKRLELLKDAVPTIASVALVWSQGRSPAAFYDALEQELERKFPPGEGRKGKFCRDLRAFFV